MKSDSIGVLNDNNYEVFSRDFLRDLAELQGTKSSGINTLVFGGRPDCITSNRRLFHPDAIVGRFLQKLRVGSRETIEYGSKMEV